MAVYSNSDNAVEALGKTLNALPEPISGNAGFSASLGFVDGDKITIKKGTFASLQTAKIDGKETAYLAYAVSSEKAGEGFISLSSLFKPFKWAALDVASKENAAKADHVLIPYSLLKKRVDEDLTKYCELCQVQQNGGTVLTVPFFKREVKLTVVIEETFVPVFTGEKAEKNKAGAKCATCKKGLYARFTTKSKEE